MSLDPTGRLSFVLSPHKNRKGDFYMGRTHFGGAIDFTNKTIFAYPQPGGGLLLHIEEYDPKRASHEKPNQKQG